MRLYPQVLPAVFLERPNRFIARCRLAGEEVVCHVKNTGRCRELLYPGVRVWLTPGTTPGRKTAYDLVAADKGGRVINLDSLAPNRVFEQWAQEGRFLPDLTSLRPEVRWGESRFDFAFTAGGREGFAEIKGVTLEEDGIAYFPDAPTQRGQRHVEQLIQAVHAGYEAFVCFVIPVPGVRGMRPNDRTHPAFGQALLAARAAGVHLLALGCQVMPEGFSIAAPVPLWLPGDAAE